VKEGKGVNDRMKSEKEIKRKLKEVQTTLNNLRASALHTDDKVYLMGEEYALKWVLGKEMNE
jgi:hypothetical protein